MILVWIKSVAAIFLKENVNLPLGHFPKDKESLLNDLNRFGSADNFLLLLNDRRAVG